MMRPKTLSVAVAVAIAIAAVGAVGMVTTLSFVQEAEANACNSNFKNGFKVTGSCTQGKFFTDPADDNIHDHFD